MVVDGRRLTVVETQVWIILKPLMTLFSVPVYTLKNKQVRLGEKNVDELL